MTHQTLVELVAKWRDQTLPWEPGCNACLNRCAEELEDALTGQEGAAPSPRAEGSTNALRAAWEAGFRLCRSYGDNHAHFDGEQKERQWNAYLAELAEGTEPATQREGAAFGATLVAIAEASYPTDEPTADDMREGAAQEPPPQAEERER